MTIALGGRNLPIGGVVAAIGGIVAAAGAFLAWETVSSDLAALAGIDPSLSGFSANGAGKIMTILAIVAVLVAVAWLLGVKLPKPAILLTVVGVCCLLMALLAYKGINDDVTLNNSVIEGVAKVGIGAYLSIVGAAAVVVGGVLGFFAKKAA